MHNHLTNSTRSLGCRTAACWQTHGCMLAAGKSSLDEKRPIIDARIRLGCFGLTRASSPQPLREPELSI